MESQAKKGSLEAVISSPDDDAVAVNKTMKDEETRTDISRNSNENDNLKDNLDSEMNEPINSVPCKPTLDKVLGEAMEEEKENLHAEQMVDFIAKTRKSLKYEEQMKEYRNDSKELEEIKEQVRMLQQQHMYQVQMLNYLHFQLSVMVSNPQSPRNQSGSFHPSAINGLHLQNMPQILAAAASMTGQNAPGTLPPNGLFPSAINPTNILETADLKNDDSRERQGDLSGRDMMPNSSDKPNSAESYNPLSSLALLQQASSNAPPMNGVNDSYMKPNGGRVSESASDNGFMKHSCRFCQKVFGSDSALQIHLRSHTGERPFKCNICANRFSTKGNLKVHFVRHQDKYPHIEMNANPVPEYLDNVPTSSGIPYGMSVVPDYLDGKSSDENSTTPTTDKPHVELPAPFQAIDSVDSITHRRPEKFLPGLDEVAFRNAIANQLMVKEGSQSPISNQATDLSEDEAKNAASQMPSNSPNRSIGEEDTDQANSLSPSAHSSALPDDNSSRKPSSEISNPITTALLPYGDGVNLARPGMPSSETSKLQQLVEQIDKGKALEKNECHICHRVLSCQSALKLHYRTHTGERPYKCDLCSRAFTTRGNLRTHYSSVHRQQLRNSPPHGGISGRTAALQCPLCGSRFMDQQSMQQHMQMHLFMHSQHQQQQVTQMMSGNGPSVDYRMLGMAGSVFPGRMPGFDSNQYGNDMNVDADQQSTENDDVFEENLPKQNNTLENDAEDYASRNENRDISSTKRENFRSLPSMTEEQNLNGDHDCDEKSSAPVPRNHGSLSNPEGNDDDRTALDLTHTENVPKPEDGISAESKDSVEEMQDINSQSSLNTVASSLNALAQLASHNAIMRPTNMPVMNLPVSLSSEEARTRKMTTACEICSKPFTCQSALEIHLRSHTKERPFLCRVCERGFTTKGNLKQHLLTHNITDVEDEMLEPVSSPLTANSNSPSNSPSFHNGTPTSAAKRPLEASQSAPAAKRNYPRHWCHICQKQFSSASSLQIHNRTHTGEKPFACSVCGRAFTTKGNLKVHMGTHVWGAGGSRRGRRISMDNPLISPWMQNTSSSNAVNPALRSRVPPQLPSLPDSAALYQQYAALASSLVGAKAATDVRLQGNAMFNFSNAAAARLLLPTNHVATSSAAPSVGQPLNPALKDSSKTMAAAAQEWIWKAYQRTQEQVN
ncbi:unnamed protein product [Clavelina lepadiformis]|uniref:C2H2-type domain-containing protein n=1 Tax=Clavelina lepadiformis TaxID=159417 RepID=A0ABP0GRZ1_CLALP